MFFIVWLVDSQDHSGAGAVILQLSAVIFVIFTKRQPAVNFTQSTSSHQSSVRVPFPSSSLQFRRPHQTRVCLFTTLPAAASAQFLRVFFNVLCIKVNSSAVKCLCPRLRSAVRKHGGFKVEEASTNARTLERYCDSN